jgi:hypothetical protein
VKAATTSPFALSRRSFLLAGAPALWPFGPARVRLCGLEFTVLKRGNSPLRLIVLHGDEVTARTAVTVLMRTQAGVAHLIDSQTRQVRVAGGMIDPNRLFSRAGAERSYLKLNPGMTDAALQKSLNWLDRNRPKLLEAILPPAGGLLLSVHNNSRGYSLEEEVGDSRRTSLPRRTDPFAFFLATNDADFELLAKGPYNALLQNNPKSQDDGSLSRLCAARAIRYVNLEVALGKLELQEEMLAWVTRTLPE